VVKRVLLCDFTKTIHLNYLMVWYAQIFYKLCCIYPSPKGVKKIHSYIEEKWQQHQQQQQQSLFTLFRYRRKVRQKRNYRKTCSMLNHLLVFILVFKIYLSSSENLYRSNKGHRYDQKSSQGCNMVDIHVGSCFVHSVDLIWLILCNN